jgi:hypothetical protein
MTAYTITFKKSPRAAAQTLVRFAENREQAIESAEKALDETYYGKATLIAVVETEDPRN